MVPFDTLQLVGTAGWVTRWMCSFKLGRYTGLQTSGKFRKTATVWTEHQNQKYLFAHISDPRYWKLAVRLRGYNRRKRMFDYHWAYTEGEPNFGT